MADRLLFPSVLWTTQTGLPESEPLMELGA